jgi:LUD domain
VTDFIQGYWKKRLEDCRAALERNDFEVFLAKTPDQAKEIILSDILPRTGAKKISWGDSMTLHEIGILEHLKNDPNYSVLETFNENLPRPEIIERRRQALLVDLFFTGTNAVTESGALVNLDMIGNRIAAITFGPRNVVITVGRNKITADIGQAMQRIKNYAAPVNAIRHPGFKTPCMKTSFCMDCKSPDRICNVWAITEKSYPKGRIKIILINQDLGL